MSSYIPPVICFDQIRPAPILWRWKPYLARGKLALLDGDPGAGKSIQRRLPRASMSAGELQTARPAHAQRVGLTF